MYVRPHLNFCDVLYHTPKFCNMSNSSFRILSKGFNIRLRCHFLVPGKAAAPIRFMMNLGREVFLTEDGFIGLCNFLKYKMLSLLHILKHQFLIPRYHLFGTRNDVHSIKCRTNYFNPHSINIWNEIGPTLRKAPSSSILKSNILKLNRQEKKNVLNIHDPKGIKRLFQLRVGLSPLRHKKRQNIKDILCDICPCKMSVIFTLEQELT